MRCTCAALAKSQVSVSSSSSSIASAGGGINLEKDDAPPIINIIGQPASARASTHPKTKEEHYYYYWMHCNKTHCTREHKMKNLELHWFSLVPQTHDYVTNWQLSRDKAAALHKRKRSKIIMMAMVVVVVVATTYQRHFHLGHNQLSVPKHIIIVPQHAVDSPEPVRDSFDRVLCFHSASRALCATIIFIGQRSIGNDRTDRVTVELLGCSQPEGQRHTDTV